MSTATRSFESGGSGDSGGRSGAQRGSDGAGVKATDTAGNLYLTGTFRFTADLVPGPGVDDRTVAGSEDIFVMK